jgi:AbrB family looped-hinge helix DNA binding protein
MTPEKAVVTSKGQLVIPARLRKRLKIKKGTVVAFSEDNGRLILQPVTDEWIASLKGSLKGGRALEYLLAERKKDREL